MNDIFDDKLGVHGDDFYGELMKAHEGLDEAQSHALNARLVLMMANQIGDIETIRLILESACKYNAQQ